MKIKIVGFPFLHDRLLEEGNEFVKSGEDIFLNEQADGELPRVVVESLGLEVRQEKEYFSVVKFFHEGFSSQTIVAIPMRGFMPGGLGLDMVSGYACRFVDKAPPLFENESLGEMLREMRYTGFLTAGFGRDLCSLRLGAGLVFYNVLEGIPGLLTDFLTKRGRLLESWTYSVLLSRYPFPAEGKAERIAFAVDPSASRHLHFFGAERSRLSDDRDKDRGGDFVGNYNERRCQEGASHVRGAQDS